MAETTTDESKTTTDQSRVTTDQQLQDAVGTLAGLGGSFDGSATQGLDSKIPFVNPIKPTVSDNQLIGSTSGQLDSSSPVAASTSTATTTGLDATVPALPAKTVGQIDSIEKVEDNLTKLGPADAAKLTPTKPYVDMTGVEGTVSAGSQATAATEALDPQATVQYQLGQLMGSIQSGAPLPPWASPGVRKVSAMMQARGLGASSMAAAAITQSLMESGVQIAARDADKYAAIQLQNLNNKQQTALANAAVYAAMDKSNLSARLQGAVTEAQSLLSVDLKNLDNEQKSNTLSYSALTQGLFKDAAEENARNQFNAKNELQVEEFFAELGSQVETANANRTAAMRQYNASEENAMAQYNTTLADSRDKFNASMTFAVDQSNAVWRREVNTQVTAIQNETNRINTQNFYNASQNALNNLWHQYRDNASWNFQKGENALEREHTTAINAMQIAAAESAYTQQQKDDMAALLGSWLARII